MATSGADGPMYPQCYHQINKMLQLKELLTKLKWELVVLPDGH